MAKSSFFTAVVERFLSNRQNPRMREDVTALLPKYSRNHFQLILQPDLKFFIEVVYQIDELVQNS